MINLFGKLTGGMKKTSDKIIGGISDIFSGKKIDAATIEDLEEILLLADMGYQATTEIIKKFSSQKVDKEADIVAIKQKLADEICTILKPCQQELVFSNETPQVVLLVGVNGAGKTTTIGKLAHKFKGKQISFIAGDTFRAAAVEQLKVWGDRNNIKVYSGASGCDAAGLCYDGLNAAIKNSDELVFIDTAGRLQNKADLAEELKKIVRVIKKVIPQAPHHTLLCVDATGGQNVLDQVKTFKEICGVNGVIMNKLDGTAKGGILVAVAHETKVPIYYIGVGEGIDDLQEFDAQSFSHSLLGL